MYGLGLLLCEKLAENIYVTALFVFVTLHIFWMGLYISPCEYIYIYIYGSGSGETQKNTNFDALSQPLDSESSKDY